jgi:Transglutaminase-like superfamily
MIPEANSQVPSPFQLGPDHWHVAVGRAPQLLVWKALVGLFLFDLRGFGHNFAKMHRYVSGWRSSRRTMQDDTVDRVCAAMNYACVWYPKRVLCVQRSAVTTCLLRHCGVSAQMVMGAQSLPFKAHAWTEVCGRAVNERRDVESIYAVWERC